MTKLAILLSHPTQYYSPWFRWLAQHSSLRVRVFYLWDFGVNERKDPKFQRSFKWDVDLLSGYESEFLPNRAAHPATDRFSGLWNPSVGDRLRAYDPEALLMFGYQSRTHLLALAWARRRGVPVVFRGDSHFLGRAQPGFGRLLLLRTLYRQFAAFLPVGQANLDYFRRLGVPERKCFFAPHSVDASRFDPSDARIQADAAMLRASLGCEVGTIVILYAGKLVPDKQPLQLLQAFVEAAAPNSALVFVGDGPLRAELSQAAAPHRNVHLLPFANQSEMPARYAMAQLFTLPSRGVYETWGLAVNEAMHLGVPALVSDLVGCQRDLVQDGETGWVWPANGEETLSCTLGRALAGLGESAARQSYRERVLKRISRYTYRTTTAGLFEALASTLPHTHLAIDAVDGP